MQDLNNVPAIPDGFLAIAARAAAEAGFEGFRPDACLINRYEPGARLAFHGIAPLADGDHPRLGRQRINLTFRRAA